MAKMQALKNFHIVRCKCMYVCIYSPAREQHTKHHARRTARPKGAYSEWCIFNSFTGCFTMCSDKITARFLANGQILLIIDVKTFFTFFLFLSRFYVFNVFFILSAFFYYFFKNVHRSRSTFETTETH